MRGPPPAAPLIVLVVDDSPVTRKMLIHALEVARIPLAEVREAENGEQALFSIARSTPDLVLCDVHMPTMDGTELLERLSCGGWTPSLPIVMISSERGAAARSRLTGFGARACIEKPFYPEALARVVRGVLGLAEVP